jgi:flagellar biosynthesis protein FlhA
MNPILARLQGLLGPNAVAIKALMAPAFIIMVLAMMVLPLPPFALDLLFTFNIAMALMVMIVASYMLRPLDFAAFPTVILLTTLLRLSLNVASTRVVLLEGHTGPGAAGAVIESFGHFLIGGNFAVGLVVFAILVVINFMVVTKGAERIAEVGARFTLDAMPGKQMAIDADLNAGLIDEKEARRRRGSRVLRLHGRCLQVRARRRAGGPADPVHQHHRRLHHRRAAARPVGHAGG